MVQLRSILIYLCSGILPVQISISYEKQTSYFRPIQWSKTSGTTNGRHEVILHHIIRNVQALHSIVLSPRTWPKRHLCFLQYLLFNAMRRLGKKGFDILMPRTEGSILVECSHLFLPACPAATPLPTLALALAFQLVRENQTPGMLS